MRLDLGSLGTSTHSLPYGLRYVTTIVSQPHNGEQDLDHQINFLTQEEENNKNKQNRSILEIYFIILFQKYSSCSLCLFPHSLFISSYFSPVHFGRIYQQKRPPLITKYRYEIRESVTRAERVERGQPRTYINDCIQ